MLEDDSLMWRAVQRIVGHSAEVVAAGSCAIASDLLAAGRWTGLVVDISLPDGSGLAWLAAARRRGHETPALVLTNNLDRALVNEAFSLRAFYVCKPAPPGSLREFVETLALRDRTREMFRGFSVSAMRVLEMSHLSRCELDVVASALSGIQSAEFIDLHRITINTYKTRVRSILRKTKAQSIGEIRDRILRDLSVTSSETTPGG